MRPLSSRSSPKRRCPHRSGSAAVGANRYTPIAAASDTRRPVHHQGHAPILGKGTSGERASGESNIIRGAWRALGAREDGGGRGTLPDEDGTAIVFVRRAPAGLQAEQV